MNAKSEVYLLTCWFYGVNNKAFTRLLDELNVIECTYMHKNEDDEQINDDRIIGVNLLNPLSHYLDGDVEYELDDIIVDLMKPYEQLCMDVLNRWRRTYSTNDSYAEIKYIYWVLLRYWNNYILKHKINLMIINVMPHTVDEFMSYAVCKAYSIPTIIQDNITMTKGEKLNTILRPSHDAFDDNLKIRYKYFRNKYKNNDSAVDLNREVRTYFEQFDIKNKEDKRVVFYNEKNNIFDKLKAYGRYAKRYIENNDFNLLRNKVQYMLKVKSETSRFLKKVEHMEENANLNNSFILFGLHLQPEATTTPGGGNYRDQLMAIRLISKNLPDDVYLYVKEHPAYWMQDDRLESVYESRSIEFYREIKRLRNVRLITHTLSSAELMKEAMAVVTITGTIGFEAIFQGLPVIVFGPTFYDSYPSVYRIRTDEDCKNTIEAVIKHKRKVDYREIEIFLATIQKYVIPIGSHEKAFLDNGTPGVTEEDKEMLVNKLIEFYREYYA